MQSWGPNRKTAEITIQITKSKKGNVRHAEIFAKKVVKPLFDKLLSGDTSKNITITLTVDTERKSASVSDKTYGCPMCYKCFMTKRVMKNHITRMPKEAKPKLTKMVTKHDQNDYEIGQSPVLNTNKPVLDFDKCNFRTINKIKLKKHIKK